MKRLFVILALLAFASASIAQMSVTTVSSSNLTYNSTKLTVGVSSVTTNVLLSISSSGFGLSVFNTNDMVVVSNFNG